jgi:Ca2+-binding EF-hand superfamily protein
MISSIGSSYDQIARLSLADMKQQRQEIFSQIDTNGDGSIDKAEFTAFGKLMAEKMGAPDQSDEIFSAIDTDGDGLLTETEMDAFKPSGGPNAADMKPNRQDMFNQIDTNGDSSIDKAEFAAFGELMAEETGAPDRSDEIFSMMDTDGDGLISEAEADAFQPSGGPNAADMKPNHQDMFNQIDTNGDGSIDKTEFAAFGKLMAEKIGASDQSDEIFSMMDTNGDGLISKAESDAFKPPSPIEEGALSGTTTQGISSENLETLLNSLSNNDSQDVGSFSSLIQQYAALSNPAAQALFSLLG